VRWVNYVHYGAQLGSLVSRFNFFTDGATGGGLSRHHRLIHLDQIALLLKVRVWKSGRYHPKNLQGFHKLNFIRGDCFLTSTVRHWHIFTHALTTYSCTLTPLSLDLALFKGSLLYCL
jgi:hypothetical protein